MSAEPKPGERCGNYELLDRIGQGGMGAVYRAVHPEIGRTVAIKILRSELASSEDAIARFFDEARAVNSIRHDGIVDVFDLGRRVDGSTYYVMEFLAGEDLSQLLRREGPMPASEAVPIILQVADALAAAHRRGIIHRDLKPQNLYLTTRGAERKVKLLDFGIAKLLSDASDRPTTSTGVVLGTVPYMAPEQARGEHVDARADVYSLGCILFELLTGQVPFAAKNALAVLARLAMEEPAAPSTRSYTYGVPPALDAIVLRMLAKDRDKRYSDVEEVRADLAALDLRTLPPPIASPPPRNDEDEELSATLPQHAGARAKVHVVEPDPPTQQLRTTPMPPPRVDPLRVIEDKPLEDTGRLRELSPALIDPSTERRLIRVVLPVLALLLGLGVFAYVTPMPTAVDRAALLAYLPWFGAAVLGLGALLIAVARTQQSSRTRGLVNGGVSVLAVALITTSIHAKGALTSYDILYYPMLVILDRLRAGRALARFTLVTSMLAFSLMAIASNVGLISYAPLYPGKIASDLIHDRGLLVIVVSVTVGITTLSFLLIDLLAHRVQRREAELRQLGLSLAGRVEQQVELLRRSADLRHYLPPALADAILRGDAGSKGHSRRKLTVVRVDCPVIARAADETDPEELAALLNALYAVIADRAAEHGGVVDRFFAGGGQVLFGALLDGAPETGAMEALAFSRAALGSVAGLKKRTQAAGIADVPDGRAAIHQGFATVGSFGSPNRLEFTAVGPVIDATMLVHDRAQPGQIVVTQPVETSLEGSTQLDPLGEPVTLPGTRHAVRLFTVA